MQIACDMLEPKRLRTQLIDPCQYLAAMISKGVDEPLPFAPLLHKAPTQGRHERELTRDGLLPFYFKFAC